MNSIMSTLLNKAKRDFASVHMLLHGVLRKTRRRIKASRINRLSVKRINLCCGNQKIPSYCGIDYGRGADLYLDLAKDDLPFKDNSLDVVICMSAINYFTRARGQEVINDVYRVLRRGGITRFGVQDMESIAKRYIQKDRDFFFQKLQNGTDRFEGPTLGDKFAAWFYGYTIKGYPCRYFYDYDSLSFLFKNAGFSVVEKRDFLDSRLENIDQIDNRGDQMFFLEAVK